MSGTQTLSSTAAQVALAGWDEIDGYEADAAEALSGMTGSGILGGILPGDRVGKGAGNGRMVPEGDAAGRIEALAAGLADSATARRALAEALTDPAQRRRLALLRAAANESFPEDDALQSSLAEDVADKSVYESMVAQAWETARSFAPPETLSQSDLLPSAEPPASPITSALDELARAGRTLGTVVTRALLAVRSPLTLPCLAPAMAAASPDLTLRRQIVTTSEGVQIEFQQLPGGPPYRVRVLVDAQDLDSAAGRPESRWDVASITLEEGEPSTAGAAGASDTLSNRHVLVVGLNEERQGFVDLTIGEGSAVRTGNGPSANLPAPRAALSLLSVTLSQRGSTYPLAR